MCFMFQNSSWTCDFLFLPLGSLDQFHMPHKLVLFLILNQPCSFLLSFPKVSQVNQSKTTPRLIGINIYPGPFQFNRAHLLRLTGGLKNSLVNFSKINWKATSFAVCFTHSRVLRLVFCLTGSTLFFFFLICTLPHTLLFQLSQSWWLDRSYFPQFLPLSLACSLPFIKYVFSISYIFHFDRIFMSSPHLPLFHAPSPYFLS